MQWQNENTVRSVIIKPHQFVMGTRADNSEPDMSIKRPPTPSTTLTSGRIFVPSVGLPYLWDERSRWGPVQETTWWLLNWPSEPTPHAALYGLPLQFPTQTNCPESTIKNQTRKGCQDTSQHFHKLITHNQLSCKWWEEWWLGRIQMGKMAGKFNVWQSKGYPNIYSTCGFPFPPQEQSCHRIPQNNYLVTLSSTWIQTPEART